MTTRRDLINKVIKTSPDLPPKDVANAVEIVWDSIADALVDGNRVEIRGFGSFSIGSRTLSPNSSLHNRDASLGITKIKSASYRISQSLFKKINE